MVPADAFDGFDAMQAALRAYDPLPPLNRRPPALSRYMAKKLNVLLPQNDLDLWLALATKREHHAFVDAYYGYEPESDAERREIEAALHELCAETGYKAAIYVGAKSGLYVWQIKRHKYTAAAKRREKLRRDLASGHLQRDVSVEHDRSGDRDTATEADETN